MNSIENLWNQKILTWEKCRYSAWAAANPFAWSVRKRLNIATRLIQKHFSDPSIIDVGCGTGTLSTRIKFRHYLGIDASKVAIDAASARQLKGAVFRELNIISEDVLLSDRFELCVMLGLLDWVPQEYIGPLFKKINSDFILFSYTRQQSNLRAVDFVYDLYRKFNDPETIRGASYSKSFFNKLRGDLGFKEVAAEESIISPGVVSLWTRN